MKKVFFAPIVLSISIGSIGTLHADDTQDWQGLYAGFALGGAYSKTTPKTEVLYNGYFVTNGTGSDQQQVNPILQKTIEGMDLTGSALVGYDLRVGNISYGVETDLSFMNYSESKSSGPIVYNTNAASRFTTKTTTESDFTLSVRPKVGYIIDKVQLYASAGPSISRFKTTFHYSDTFGGGNDLTYVDRKTVLGVSSGIGAGYQLSGNWLIRGDYVYTYFPDVVGGLGLLDNDGRPDFNFDGKFDSHNIRLALIKHF